MASVNLHGRGRRGARWIAALLGSAFSLWVAQAEAETFDLAFEPPGSVSSLGAFDYLESIVTYANAYATGPSLAFIVELNKVCAGGIGQLPPSFCKSVSIGSMFTMQLLINHLQDLETDNVVSINSGIVTLPTFPIRSFVTTQSGHYSNPTFVDFTTLYDYFAITAKSSPERLQEVYSATLYITPLSGAIPEPSTRAMLLLGFVGLGFAGYRSGWWGA